MEAGMLSPATMKRFKHNDTEHLRQLLHEQSNSLVVTEGCLAWMAIAHPWRKLQL